MFRQSLNTWTFYLLFVAVAITFSNGASLPIAQNEPHTMYEAIVSKCPQLENTKLKENSDIFTSQCVDWAKINPSNLEYNKTKIDSSCLVLYESLLSFCTQLGDHVAKFDGIIPIASYLKDYTMERVCFNNETRNSLTKTEHNISNLLTPSSCVYLCGEFTETGLVLQSDVCKYAYYFATFNVSKFLAASNLLHKNDENSSINEPQSANKTSTNNIAQEDKGHEETKPHNEDQLQVGKPQQTVNDEQGQNEVHAPAHPPEQPVDNNPNLIESKKEDTQTQVDVVKVAEPVDIHKSDHPLDKPDNSAIENAVISKPKPDAVPSANANVESLESTKTPKETKKAPEPEPAVEESPLEGSDDKIQDNISEGEDQEQFMEDEAEEANAAKAEPVMPEETEQKTPSKKVKPNTVEDEAISSYNTPDDDMDGDSYFFSYFTVIMCLFIVGYVGYHNRQKILALLLEGQKGKRSGRQSRRPNSANYHKLDSNLEEAISSSCTKNASNVIY